MEHAKVAPRIGSSAGRSVPARLSGLDRHADPLKRDKGHDYGPANLTDYFRLDENAVDYTYPVPASGEPAPFTTGTPVTYDGAVVLSRQPTRSLTAQIDQYEKLYPQATMKARLDKAKAAVRPAQIMSQGIGDFDLQQMLRRPIGRVPVEDLVTGDREFVTSDIARDATATAGDSWYAMAFNSLSPIAKDLLAAKFRPAPRRIWSDPRPRDHRRLRPAIDAADHDRRAPTAPRTPCPPITSRPRLATRPTPRTSSTRPRLLPPSRLWFKWLSAAFDSTVPGLHRRLRRMNAHPPPRRCAGGSMPNHLDVSLFFYDADGRPFGSFGVEHDALVYRTRAATPPTPRTTSPSTSAPRRPAARRVSTVMSST